MEILIVIQVLEVVSGVKKIEARFHEETDLIRLVEH